MKCSFAQRGVQSRSYHRVETNRPPARTETRKHIKKSPHFKRDRGARDNPPWWECNMKLICPDENETSNL